MGTVEHNDNARLLNERRDIVASFYPPEGWFQVGDLSATADLPPRQLFEITLRDKDGGKEIASADILPQKTSMYQWPAEVAQLINAAFPETMLRAGESAPGDKIEPVAGSSYRNKVWLNKKDHGDLEFSMARKTWALVNGEKWINIDAIRSSAALPIGGTVAVALRDKNSGAEVSRVELAATNGNNGMYAWPEHLARKINEENLPNLRAGELQADGSIQAVANSSYRNQIWIPVAQRDKLAVALIHTETSGRHAYQYKYPDNIGQYRAGTRVLGKDGAIYQCKPLPYAGWCRIYSPSANQYEPGRGSNWRDAWEKLVAHGRPRQTREAG